MSLNLNISFYENPSLSYSTAKLLLSKNNFSNFYSAYQYQRFVVFKLFILVTR